MRPTAKPTKPGTSAPVSSQWTTFGLIAAPPEHHTPHVLASASPRRLGDADAVAALVEPLDLPDVRLDAARLELADRVDHESRPQLAVVAVGVAADGRQLLLLGGHQQLEQERATRRVEPLAEAREPLCLPAVHRDIAARVVAHEYFRVGGVERRDVLAEVVPVLEVELVLPALLDGHRELRSERARAPCDVRSELLVDEDPRAGERKPAASACRKPSKMTPLASEIRAASSAVGSPGMPRSFFWNEPRWSKASR